MLEPTRVLGVESDGFAPGEAIPEGTMLQGGNYVIQRSLGRGGFGITYFARDQQLERDVVVKECFPESICHREGLDLAVRSPANAPHFRKCVEMFIREARSIARLSHPNIVNVFAIFEENQTAYMVLDLIHGSDLLDIIETQNKIFSPDDIRAILTDVLGALTVVHDQNLLHRDISPDNILLDDKGHPTLIDFGSAREFASERARESTSLLFVKDGYSPFEFYVSGAAHSPASDLYALGGTFYHLIAGEAPPSSQLRSADLQAERPDPCRPLAGRFAGYDPGFLEAIDKAMSLTPSKRIQTTRDWLRQLASQRAAETNKTESPKSQATSALGDLVSQTNQDVLGRQPQAAQPAGRPDAFAVDLGLQPVWRDEFNRETEELLAQESMAEPDSAQDNDIYYDDPDDLVTEQEDLHETGRDKNARSTAQTEDARLVQAQIAAYYQQKDPRKARQRSGRNPGPIYIFGGLFGVILAAFIAVNQEQMKEDGSWRVVFSLQGFCRSEFFQTHTPIEVDCETRQDVRKIDMTDRDRLIQLRNTDRGG